MTPYPTQPRALSRTLAGDIAVVLAILVFAWLGVKVHDAVAELAGLGRGLADAGTAVQTTSRGAAGSIRDGFNGAADAIQGAPLVGGAVSGALRDAGGATAGPLQREGDASARKLIVTGHDGEQRAYHTANLLGWLTFLLPTALLLAWRLPPRVRQARALGAARRVLRDADDPARAAELARRAAYGLPYATLLRHTPDPFGDLLAGRHEGLLAALGEDADLRV